MALILFEFSHNLDGLLDFVGVGLPLNLINLLAPCGYITRALENLRNKSISLRGRGSSLRSFLQAHQGGIYVTMTNLPLATSPINTHLVDLKKVSDLRKKFTLWHVKDQGFSFSKKISPFPKKIRTLFLRILVISFPETLADLSIRGVPRIQH